MADLERQALYSADFDKIKGDVYCQPSDLGGATLHTFLRRRHVTVHGLLLLNYAPITFLILRTSRSN